MPFIEARVKEAASVKAPTRTSKSGRKYATTRATPGAPLRVVSGRFRNSITSQMENETTGVVGSNAHADLSHAAQFVAALTGDKASGFNYPAHITPLMVTTAIKMQESTRRFSR